MRFWILLVTLLGLSFFFSRWILVLPPDAEYLNHYFINSQWRNSYNTRVISDNELYQIAGLQLAQGVNPFDINPEVPPLAKYFFGWSWQHLGNPYWATLFFFVTTPLVFLSLAKKLLPLREARLATLLLALTPLYITQMTWTMLDLPQLFWLLCHIYLILCLGQGKVKFTAKKQVVVALLAGVTLGAAAATKFPLLIPVIMIADSFYLWQQKRWQWLGPILGLTGLVYLLSYWQYFRLGHSLIDWLKAQKWMYHFYSQSRTQLMPLTFWDASLRGWFKGWWGAQGTAIPEWSLIWPLVLVIPLVRLRWLKLKRLPHELLYLYLLFIGLVALFSLIPFWPRYFLTLLPLGLILTTPWLVKLPKVVLITLIGVLLFQTVLFWRPQPTESLNAVATQWQAANYEDAATYIYPAALSFVQRQTFADQLRKADFFLGGRPTRIFINAKPVNFWQDQAQAELVVLYPTTQITQPLLLERLHNRWFIRWDKPATSQAQ